MISFAHSGGGRYPGMGSGLALEYNLKEESRANAAASTGVWNDCKHRQIRRELSRSIFLVWH